MSQPMRSFVSYEVGMLVFVASSRFPGLCWLAKLTESVGLEQPNSIYFLRNLVYKLGKSKLKVKLFL